MTYKKTEINALKQILKINEKERRGDLPNGTVCADSAQVIICPYCGIVLNAFHKVSEEEIPVDTNSNTKITDVFLGITQKAICENTLSISQYIPALPVLKSYQKAVKEKADPYNLRGGIPFFLGDDLVNAKYLTYMLTIFPDADIFVNPDFLLKPILFKSKRGLGILLPVRPNKEFNAPYIDSVGVLNKPVNKSVAFGIDDSFSRKVETLYAK